MKIAAFIPARKNSKRIPKKNLIEFNEDYLINKVIRNLKSSHHSIEIYISTDDDNFKNIINEQVTFLDRPAEFSDDFSTVSDLMKWHFENDLRGYDIVIQPFCHSICIPAKTYDDSLKILKDSKKNALLTISRLEGPVEWTFKIKSGELKPNFPNSRNKRSQDLGISYIDAGQFYIYKKAWFEENIVDEYESQYEWIEIEYFQSNDLDEVEDINKLKINYEICKKKLLNLE